MVRQQRLDVLRRFKIIANAKKPILQRYSALAKAIFSSDYSVLCLSSAETESQMCLTDSTDLSGTFCSVPSSQTVCGHAMLLPDQVLVIPDISKDWLFHGLPCTKGGYPNPSEGKPLHFYASAPIRVNPSGPTSQKGGNEGSNIVTIGRLCVLGGEPRSNWTPADSEILNSIATMCSGAFENDYLQQHAFKVSEMQRAMASLARNLGEDVDNDAEPVSAGAGLAPSAIETGGTRNVIRVCPVRVQQACEHLHHALHADSVTAVDLSDFRFSSNRPSEPASGTSYPLTPWLSSPSVAPSQGDFPSETTNSAPMDGLSQSSAEQRSVVSGISVDSSLSTQATGSDALGSDIVPGGSQSFWQSHERMTASTPTTSLSGVPSTPSAKFRDDTKPERRDDGVADPRPTRDPPSPGMQSPRIVTHLGAPDLLPRLDEALQREALSRWLTDLTSRQNPLRPQVFRERRLGSEIGDTEDEDDEAGRDTTGQRSSRGAGVGLGVREDRAGHPRGSDLLASLNSMEAETPSIIGRAASKVRLSPPAISSGLSAPEAQVNQGEFAEASSIATTLQAQPDCKTANQSSQVRPKAQTRTSSFKTGRKSKRKVPRLDAASNSLKLLIPNARQWAALPIFSASRSNAVVLLLVTFRTEIPMEESELLFLESVGAVLHSSLLAQQARAVDRAQLSLIRGLQHEFRTPLHGILGIVDAIEGHEEDGDTAITSDPALLHNLLESIRLASTSLNGLLDDVLTFGEITGVQQTGAAPSTDPRAAAIDELDLGDLIEEVALEELLVRQMSLNQAATSQSRSVDRSPRSRSLADSDGSAADRSLALQKSARHAEPRHALTKDRSEGDVRILKEPAQQISSDSALLKTKKEHETSGWSGHVLEAVEDSSVAASETSHTISLRERELPPELIIDTLDLRDRFRCDRIKVQKALRKLINNALRFTPRGHVKITARQRPSETSDKQVIVDIDIADTGPGMTRNFIDTQLMKPFVKGSAFDSGVGLGNVIAASLTAQMGGQLQVASKVGEGTQVLMSLPLTPLGPTRATLSTRGHGCHAVSFIGCDDMGVDNACNFLRKVLRKKNVLPVEEIGGLPDLLVVSERVLDALHSSGTWENSGFHDSIRKALMSVSSHARVLVVSRGGLRLDRINFGLLGTRPIHVIRMPYGPSTLRELDNFLEPPKSVPRRQSGVRGDADAADLRSDLKRLSLHRGRAQERDADLDPSPSSAELLTSSVTPAQLSGQQVSPKTRPSDKLEPEKVASAAEAAGVAVPAEDKLSPSTDATSVPLSQSPEEALAISPEDRRKELDPSAVDRPQQQTVRGSAFSPEHVMADDEFRVLVVEDNPINLKLLTTLCKHLKIKYEEAMDGVEAVEKYLSFRPSVVLLDISLPEQDGFQAAAQMRSHPPFTSHPPRIVAITALSSEQDKIRGLTECGMDIWLTKPVSTRTLQKDLLEMESEWKALHTES
ncbi:hypothetical protein V8E36_000797 [Tilletia maclaganii]